MITFCRRIPLLLIGFGLFQSALTAQTLNTAITGPDEALINEEVCLTVAISNTGEPGYQPYLRLVLPPELPANTLRAEFMGQDIPQNQLITVGVFSGGTFNDPNLPVGDPNRQVAGASGHSLVLVNLPLGAASENGIEYAVSLCATLNGPNTALFAPVTLQVQSLYRYGGSAAGDEPSIFGTTLSHTVTPIPYTVALSRDPSVTVGGQCASIEYAFSVDIATQQLVTGLNLSAQLPPGMGYGTLISGTPGCAVQQPTPGSAGTVNLQCTNVMGDSGPEDVKVVFVAQAIAGPEPSVCDSLVLATAVNVTSNQAPPQHFQMPLPVFHVTFTPVAEAEVIAPLQTITMGALVNVSGAISALGELGLTLVIPDGLTYVGNPQYNGQPCTGVVTSPLGNGQTALSFDFADHTTLPQSCEAVLFTFEVVVNETYADGSLVASRDVLEVAGTAHYAISGEATCARPFATSVSISAPQFEKTVVSAPANGLKYVPGELVTYRLSIEADAIAIQNAVMEDFLPIPVHRVADLNPVFGTSISHAPNDNAGLVPQTIALIEATNSVRIEWGDVPASLPGSPTIIAVDLQIEVSDEPFAPFLFHSNFARFTWNNSVGGVQNTLTFTTIEVGAPALQVWKGVEHVDNEAVTLEPWNPGFLQADANDPDAFDWVTFRTSIRNNGDAPAYDAVVNYFPDNSIFHQCAVLSAETVDGNPVPYTGNLYGAGLVLETIAPGTSNRVFLRHRCRVRSTAPARRTVDNTSIVSWASVQGGSNYFAPVSDSCQVRLARPSAALAVVQVQPGHGAAGEVHIGELITFEAAYRMPEGITQAAELDIELPLGLAVESIVSFEPVQDVTFASGTYASILNNAQILPIGTGVENERRRLRLLTGNIANVNSNNTNDEWLRVVFTATVLNTPTNQSGQVLEPLARIRYTNPNNGQQVAATASQSVAVVEPDLNLSLALFDANLLPEGQTFVTLTIAHSALSTGHAYNVQVVNDLPLGLQYVPGSLVTECEDLFSSPPVFQSGTLTLNWDSIPMGTSCEFVYAVQAIEGLPPCVAVENQASLTWASAHAGTWATLPIAPAHPQGVRRTGNPNQAGGALNDYQRGALATTQVVVPNLTTPQISGFSQACAGSPVSLSIEQYSGGFVEYSWFLDGTPINNNSHQLALPSASTAQTGQYTAQVQIGQCLTALSQPFSLSITPNPTVTLNDFFFPCTSGTESVQLTADVVGEGAPFTYTWTGPNYLSSQATATIINASDTQSGVYSLVVTDANGCTSATASALVTITSAPPTPQLSGGASVCEGQSVTLTASSYNGAETYHWQTPTGEVVTAAPNMTLNGVTAAQSGTYSVWVQLPACATETSLPVEVIVDENPETPVFSVSESQVCSGETLVFTTDTQAGGYQWSGPNGYSGNTATPPAIENIGILGSGTYQLIVNNGNCVSQPYTLEVEVLPLPPAPAVSQNGPLCVGETLELSSPAVAEAFNWSFPGSDETLTASGTLTVNSITTALSGIYALSVFDGQCWSPATTVTVHVDEIPNEQAYAGANAIACADGVAVVQAVNNPGLQGVWSSPADDLTFASPNSQTSGVTGMIPGESHLAVWSLYNAGCGVFSSDEVTVYTPLDPLAVDDYYEITEGEQPNFAVLANDEAGVLAHQVSIVSPPLNGNAQVVEQGLVRYTPNPAFAGDDRFVYRVCLTACPERCDTAEVQLRVFTFLRIPHIITHTGDGVNDALVIEGIHRFPANELLIYNRWGREVFAAENYENNWDATWQGKPLPHGTYFYVLNNRATGENLGKGYITVHQ